MTAIVAILNKAAVSLAADSAATVTNAQGQKVYNHANKLFNLSDYHPVGLMIYNWLDLVGIPWETIVKMYRRELGKQEFPLLTDYAKHFLQYINKFKAKIENNDKIDYINNAARDFCVSLSITIDEEAAKDEQFDQLPDDERNIAIDSIIINQILPLCITSWQDFPVPTELTSYNLAAFESEYGESLRVFVTQFFQESSDYSPSPAALEAFVQLLYEAVRKSVTFGSTQPGPWSGLVFTGFGKEEIYPTLVSYRIGLLLGNEFRIFEDENTKISSQNTATIVPYAQKDVILSFLTGIDPVIKNSINVAAAESLNTLIGDVIPLLNSEQQLTIQQRAQELTGSFTQSVEDVSAKKSTLPIINTVAALSKEDLADMAESLISLTYLKRRISFVVESVGGPIDVAIITKGEGFIWLKRKQYFKPELNLNYLAGVLHKPR